MDADDGGGGGGGRHYGASRRRSHTIARLDKVLDGLETKYGLLRNVIQCMQHVHDDDDGGDDCLYQCTIDIDYLHLEHR